MVRVIDYRMFIKEQKNKEGWITVADMIKKLQELDPDLPVGGVYFDDKVCISKVQQLVIDDPEGEYPEGHNYFPKMKKRKQKWRDWKVVIGTYSIPYMDSSASPEQCKNCAKIAWNRKDKIRLPSVQTRMRNLWQYKRKEDDEVKREMES